MIPVRILSTGHDSTMSNHVQIDRERCKGCVLCVDICPKKVLVMSKALNSKGLHFATVAHQEKCIACLQCATICPDAAVEVEKETD